MKAMILAAGEGTRLRPLTERMPKPMIAIAGRPILEHNIRLLARHGIRELVINLHHCSKAVKDYFGDGHSWGVSITYSYEPVLLGTAGAVKKLESFFDSTFLVVYGDNLTTCDIKQLCAFHQEKGGTGTVALFHREDPSGSGIAELDENDRITCFLEKPKPEQVFSHWVNAGLLVLKPEVLEYIPAGQPTDFSQDVLPTLLEAGYPLYGYRMREELWWIDTLEDLQRVREDGRWKIEVERRRRKGENRREKMEGRGEEGEWNLEDGKERMEVGKGRMERRGWSGNGKLQCERWVFDGEKWVPEEAEGRRQIQTHKDLDVFNLGYTLAMEVFRVSAKFPKEERFSLTNQIRRSSRSVCSNIVESFAKRRYEAVFKNSLNDSLGESEETKLWLNLALDCEYLSREDRQQLTAGYDQVSAMLWTLMTKWETYK